MVKKGFLKKTGCILISASIILAGWTFMGSSTSGAEVDENIVLDTPAEAPSEPEESNIITTDNETEEGIEATEPVEGDSTPGTEPAAETVEGTDDAATEELEETPSPMMRLRSFATSLLAAPLGATADETVIEGSTLVKVSSALTEYTVPASITTIAANAFADSNVSTLTFANGNNITSIGSQGGWPANGTDIYCPNTPSTATVVQYFLNLDRDINVYFFDGPDEETTYIVYITEVYGSASVEKTYYEMSEGEVIYPTTHAGYSCSDMYVVTDEDYQEYTFTYTENTGISVMITEVFGGESVILPEYTGLVAGDKIYPTEREGYTCDDVYTVTSATNQAHTFTYTPGTTTKTITITEKADKDYTVIYMDLPAGQVIHPTARAGYTCTDTYTVTSSSNQTHTFTYTKISPGVKTYTVSINEVVEDKSFPITYSNLVEGTVITPTPRAGYTCSDKYTVTSAETQAHVFTYKKNTPSPSGGGGGSSSGGSSSSGGGTPSTTPQATGYVGESAQTTSKYVITDGANQQVKQNDGSVRIVCNGAVNQLAYILLDGNKVAATNYTIQSGSTILTFTKDYIASLPVGDHAVQFQYNDGYAVTGLKILSPTAKTTTTVTYKIAADGSISAGHTKDTTPKTADGFDSRYLLCIAIFLLGAGALMMGQQRKLEAILAGQEEE